MQPARTSVPVAHEKLAWSAILERYPREWVVLVEIERDEKGNAPRSAVVLAHGPHRDECLRRAAPVRSGFREFAHLYTGNFVAQDGCDARG